jgi:hypothetical protein
VKRSLESGIGVGGAEDRHAASFGLRRRSAPTWSPCVKSELRAGLLTDRCAIGPLPAGCKRQAPRGSIASYAKVFGADGV